MKPVANNEMIFNRIVFSHSTWTDTPTMCVCVCAAFVICCVRFANVNVSCAFCQSLSRSFDFTMETKMTSKVQRAGGSIWSPAMNCAPQTMLCRHRFQMQRKAKITIHNTYTHIHCTQHANENDFDCSDRGGNILATEGRPNARKKCENSLCHLDVGVSAL